MSFANRSTVFGNRVYSGNATAYPEFIDIQSAFSVTKFGISHPPAFTLTHEVSQLTQRARRDYVLCACLRVIVKFRKK